ncbi:MAG TPA: 50S ribosomal protein L23 [Gammaproteobacteria bacterium]|nr:50S ribosomal protein L23 [Gammaproteobacteria bacterium]HWQ95200.1 50S ribosomal protein L23 [Gammaproteobacteria bacterium]
MNQERLMTVLLAPHISEKSTTVAERNKQFVFRVRPDADKGEIKGAVELMFNVQVAAVRTANLKGKVKRAGRRGGRRSDWKKAYVSLKPGFDIDFTGGK